MDTEPKHVSKTFGRQKPWSLFVMIGFGVAMTGFILLPTIILSVVALPMIAGGFAFSLGAYLAGKFRVSALKAIRKEERQGHFEE